MKFLSAESTKMLLHAFVMYRLDNYWYLSFIWTSKYDRVTPLLRELKWPPMEQRIVFKILLLTFKSINDFSPRYFRNLLQTYKPSRILRSSTMNLLVTPGSKLKILWWSCFLKLWNNLPDHIKWSLNLTSFESNLKTYLFKRYFNLWFCFSILRINYLLSYCFKQFIVRRLRALE